MVLPDLPVPPLSDRDLMREEIDFMELANRKRRERGTSLLHATGAHVENVPDLPPPLPRPEYATRPGIIGRDDEEVDFYVSCKQGRLDDVAGYVERRQPPNAVRQYGLEQASFADRPAVVRYLLESGATLHGTVFTHAHSIEEHIHREDYVHTESIFRGSGRSREIIALLEVFLDAGWNPHQPWLGAQSEYRERLLSHISRHKPVVEFLVGRLPDLRLDSGGTLLYHALRTWDTELLDLLLSRGADATLGSDTMRGSPLLSLVERCPSEVEPGRRVVSGRIVPPPVPFSTRRATAEWLLQHGVRVNGVTRMRCRDMTWPCRAWDNETALSLACAAEDYEFAEWLLENGADPGLLGGRALHQLWWAFPYFGKNDPSVVKELVERVRGRHGGKLPAEAEAGD